MLKLNIGGSDAYWRSDNLNTSHVKVKLNSVATCVNAAPNLNTSHVKVKQNKDLEKAKEILEFKYISC